MSPNFLHFLCELDIHMFKTFEIKIVPQDLVPSSLTPSTPHLVSERMHTDTDEFTTKVLFSAPTVAKLAWSVENIQG